ncbi:hypothetical protein BDN70DRAFT_875254 [Pholiota conissans]|uniref:Uncharacterized protein n=1 Tax=Pholiota conissans TaxID=109636 RepID=A0A9P5Z7M7_9AGAR|nr:hypothetical protein BDN70DRAFT_875254 [Pholiota conissans]
MGRLASLYHCPSPYRVRPATRSQCSSSSSAVVERFPSHFVAFYSSVSSWLISAGEFSDVVIGGVCAVILAER